MTTRAYGYKYEEQKGKSTAEIAALMRRDIKDAIADGLLPGAPVKYSVRTHTYSGGASIDITVQNWAGAWMDCDGFAGHEPAVAGRGRELCRQYFCAARLEMERETRPGAERHQKLTAEAEAARMTLERIHGAYNHDGSDAMTDHFDVNYYGGVKFDDARTAEWDAKEAEKKASRRAAIDAAAASGETRRVLIYGSGGRKQTVHDAVEVDGRTKLVCGATLWSHTALWDAAGRELTCTRCAKRAARKATAAAPVREMRSYEVLSRTNVVQLRPGAKSVRVTQFRTSADVDQARGLIAAMFPDAVSYRAPGEIDWRQVRD